jgi:ParB-like chromosome segregation protein Spo0J
MSKTDKCLMSINIDKLIAHKENPNRMDGASFEKLKGHIGRNGNYEPVVVRRHNERAGCFEILNGHHRVKALRDLGYEFVDAVVWDVDDDEARVLLGTLNRLCGRDDIDRKAALVSRLSERFGRDRVAELLPEKGEVIGKLIGLRKGDVDIIDDFARPLESMVFFVDSDGRAVIDRAVDKAGSGVKGNRAQRRTAGLVKVCEYYLGVQ